MRWLVPQCLIAASDVSHNPTIHFALTLTHWWPFLAFVVVSSLVGHCRISSKSVVIFPLLYLPQSCPLHLAPIYCSLCYHKVGVSLGTWDWVHHKCIGHQPCTRNLICCLRISRQARQSESNNGTGAQAPSPLSSHVTSWDERTRERRKGRWWRRREERGRR